METKGKTILKWSAIFIASIICILVFVVGIPIAINESYKVKEGYITLWGAADVLAFYAVILSGLITIAVLVVTIYYNKKDTEKQINLARSQVNVPFFIIDKVFLEKSHGDFYESWDGMTWTKEYEISRHKRKEEHENIVIVLKNIGEGAAIAPEVVFNPHLEVTKTIPKFVQKDNVLVLTYDLYSILHGKLGGSNITHDFEPFDTSLKLCYKNTLGVVFSQEVVLHHARALTRTAVELEVDTISHQCIVP